MLDRRSFFGTAIAGIASLAFGLTTAPKPVVTLRAKKLATLIRVPNELLRFASPAVETLLRDEMTKNLACGLDLQFMKA